MSDAIQVSNIDKLEPDMRIVFDMFTRAANSIVRASDLSLEVNAQGAKLASLEQAYDIMVDQRNHFDQALTSTNATLQETLAEMTRLNHKILSQEDEIAKLRMDNSFLAERLEKKTREHNQAQGQIINLAEALNTTRQDRDTIADRFSKFRELLGRLEDVATEPAKAPAETSYHPQPEPGPAPEGAYDWPDEVYTKEPLSEAGPSTTEGGPNALEPLGAAEWEEFKASVGV